MWWWIANAVLIAVVIPLVITLAVRLLEPVAEIRRYVRDVGEHAAGIRRGLAAVGDLKRTQAFIEKSREYVDRYAVASRAGGR